MHCVYLLFVLIALTNSDNNGYMLFSKQTKQCADLVSSSHPRMTMSINMKNPRPKFLNTIC